MISLLAIAFFAAWFVICLLVLIPRLAYAIQSRDYFALVPEWKFFGPEPGRWDYCLVYRDQLDDGHVTPWTEALSQARRNWWNGFWNPNKRDRKSVFDAVGELAKHAQVKDPSIAASFPYLTLLNFVSSLPRVPASEFTQFAIVRIHPASTDDQPDVIFSSSRHAL